MRVQRRNIFGHFLPASPLLEEPRGLVERPTDAAPGSPEKLVELCRRAEARLTLFHPADRRAVDAVT